MQRNITEKFIRWADQKNHKPLLVTGVRQCGKTYSILNFAENYFQNFVYLNFEEQTSAESIFNQDLNPKRILNDIQNLYSEEKITSGKTLIIFDEIQQCTNAVTSLKYFYEQIPSLHIICAGSLLGVEINRNNLSFPVGKVDRLQMFPLDFQEFVIACGEENLLNGLKNFDFSQEIPSAYTEPMINLLNNYYIVGGFPDAVKAWISSKDFHSVNNILSNIYNDYKGDFAKHAPITDIPKIASIWDSIPKQLAKENNKFMFSHVSAGKRAHQLTDALQWIFDAGLAHKVEKVENAQLPLSYYADSSYFKVYMCDVGLLRIASDVSEKAILSKNAKYKQFLGAVSENFVLLEILKRGNNVFFWRSGNSAEVDFILEHNEDVLPVEVKTADNLRAKSYSQFISKYKPKVGIKTSLKNCAINKVSATKNLNIPLYMLWHYF